MPRRFVIERATCSLQAVLTLPEYSFFGNSWQVQECLCRAFWEAGARPSNVNQSGNDPLSYRCKLELNNANVVVAVSLDKLEVLVLLGSDPANDARLMFGTLLSGMLTRWPHLQPSAWFISRGFHGEVEGCADMAGVLGSYLRIPPAGTLTSSSWRCNYAGQPPCLQSGLVLENSLLSSRGVFLQMESLWDAASCELEEVLPVSGNLAGKAIEALELEFA